MNLDKYYNKIYHPTNYNCLHFSAEIWFELTGVNLNDKLIKSNQKTIRGFKTLKVPQNPCIAIMKRPNTTSHVGIYLNGNIIHLTEMGVECFEPTIAARGFQNIRYVI